MYKYIITVIIAIVILSSCTKEYDIIPPEDSGATDSVRHEIPMFTVTMEGTSSRVTIDGMMPKWETEDRVSVNGFEYKVDASGSTTTVSLVEDIILRPDFVSGSTSETGDKQSPAKLVDIEGTNTKWCDYPNGDKYIIVSTGTASELKSIKLWNGGDTQSYPGRRWKNVRVSGSVSSDGPWEELKSFQGLDLEINNSGYAGELVIDSAEEYIFYKLDDISSVSDVMMQMSDMQFVIKKKKEIRPRYVGSINTGWYGNNPVSNLVDEDGTETRWCTHKNDRVDGIWNIIVSTGTSAMLNTISLWNADNATYPGRRWKDIKVYGSESANGDWNLIQYYQNLNLDVNNRDLAGKINVDATKGYPFYKIDVLSNEGDNYMQMSDMKFEIAPAAPYHAYYPESLFDGFSAVLPSVIDETWADGRFNMPMYAQSNNNYLHFKNICGVLRITVKPEMISTVKCIRVSSENKAVSGEFTVINDTAVLTDSTDITKSVTITYKDAVAIDTEGKTFYVAIPSQMYRNLWIELSSDGKSYSKAIVTKNGVDIPVERNRIYQVSNKGSKNTEDYILYPVKYDGSDFVYGN